MIKAIICSLFILIWNQNNYCEDPEKIAKNNTKKLVVEEKVEVDVFSWSIEEKEIVEEPIKDEVKHIKTPEKVKSLYYTAYSAGSKAKMDNLYYMIDNTEINSVTIDIKTVSWYVSFEMDHDRFSNIKPVSDWRIKDVK